MKIALNDLLRLGDLKVEKQCPATGKRKFTYMGISSPYLDNYEELKEWMKTLLIELE
jgi:hypothetical protein